MPRRFHDQDVLPDPAPLIRRLLAMLYDGLICIALLIVATGAYMLVAAQVIGTVRYRQMAETGALSGDPLLSSVLFITLFLFFGYFWTRTGQTLGMQVWRIRIETPDGLSIRWSQALLRFMMGWVSWLCAGLGYLWMLWDGGRQTWTDKFSESIVVSVPKKP